MIDALILLAKPAALWCVVFHWINFALAARNSDTANRLGMLTLAVVATLLSAVAIVGIFA